MMTFLMFAMRCADSTSTASIGTEVQHMLAQHAAAVQDRLVAGLLAHPG